jgi:hypothetical protein
MILNSGNHVVVIGIKLKIRLFFLYFEHTLWYIIRVPHDVIILLSNIPGFHQRNVGETLQRVAARGTSV